MYAATRCKEQEVCKVGMVKVAAARVYPGTVMIHLHNTSGNKRAEINKGVRQNGKRHPTSPKK